MRARVEEPPARHQTTIDRAYHAVEQTGKAIQVGTAIYQGAKVVLPYVRAVAAMAAVA